MVHRRQLDGADLVFGNQGALWGNAMTWYDHDTGSVWSQPRGEAILGPRTGARLELLASTLTTWADWRSRHPDSLALNVGDPGLRGDLDAVAIVVELGVDSLAFPIAEVRESGVANATVAGVPIAVVADPTSQSWAVFSRIVDDVVLDFELDEGQLVATGGRRFDAALGRPVGDGGTALDPLPGFTSFPSDYGTFFPDGAFWTTEGIEPIG